MVPDKEKMEQHTGKRRSPVLPGKPRKAYWHWSSLLRMFFGVFFLVLGVAGLFLPVLQGILFLVIGVALLANHIPVFARLRNAVYRHHPHIEQAVKRISAWPRHFKRPRR